MSVHALKGLSVVAVVTLIAFAGGGATGAYAGANSRPPVQQQQTLTGTVTGMDTSPARPLAAINTGSQIVIVRFPDRTFVGGIAQGDTITVRGAPAKDGIFDVTRLESVKPLGGSDPGSKEFQESQQSSGNSNSSNSNSSSNNNNNNSEDCIEENENTQTGNNNNNNNAEDDNNNNNEDCVEDNNNNNSEDSNNNNNNNSEDGNENADANENN